MLLVIGVSTLFFGCSENSLLPDLDDPVQTEQGDAAFKSAKKPAASLVGTTDIPFTFTPPTFWNGTVDFGDEGLFSMTFISHGEPRDFSQASPFFEEFVIYELGTDWTVPENVVLKGWNKGVVTYANKLPEPVMFHANGKITEAYPPLDAWIDCNFHVKGMVYFDEASGLPDRALGKVRIN